MLRRKLVCLDPGQPGDGGLYSPLADYIVVPASLCSSMEVCRALQKPSAEKVGPFHRTPIIVGGDRDLAQILDQEEYSRRGDNSQEVHLQPVGMFSG